MTSGQCLFTATGYPVFQNRMYETAEAARACPRGDISLVEDPDTGLVRNAAFDPALVDYDENYQNEQALSEAFRAHLSTVEASILAHMGREGLVEVGCGKGTFLEMLVNRGADVRGFDPTYQGDNPRIEKRYFDRSLGLSARGLILRHVLEHIPDPVRFLGELRAANGGGGLIYIEVPCFDWIRGNGAWFDIFYEHVNYFRMRDLRAMFDRVIEARHGFGGQYLCVLADLASLRIPVRDPADPAALPEGFADPLTRVPANAGPDDVIWGGASKGVIYAIARERLGVPLRAVIDINPGKQGRHLAVTGLRVSAPAEVLPEMRRGARIIVMNPNYMAEIRAMAGDAFTYVEIGDD